MEILIALIGLIAVVALLRTGSSHIPCPISCVCVFLVISDAGFLYFVMTRSYLFSVKQIRHQMWRKYVQLTKMYRDLCIAFPMCWFVYGSTAFLVETESSLTLIADDLHYSRCNAI
jgi:hypothetical protein